MKITRIDSYFIGIPYEHGAPKPVLTAADGRTTQDAVYVRVETDNGLVGWGEAFGFGSCRMSHVAIQRVVSKIAVGCDASDIGALMTDLERRTQNMSRNGPIGFALSGLDIALWDIAGKAAGKPIHALLGGARRDRVPAYASLLRLNTPDLVRAGCARALARGFKHIKLHERTVEAVAAARGVVGPDIDLMLDTNCTWTLDQAMQMAERLRPYGLTWLEEPVFPPDDYEALATLRRVCGIPIAAGENLGNTMDVRHILAAQAVDFLQPDVAKMGGITAMRASLEMADAAGKELHPHSPLFGPALAATLHILATMPKTTACEFYFADLENNPIGAIATPVDGAFAVPQGAGLGINVDEAMLARYRID
jgi:D-galactarolactone cycloisomerase